MDGKRKITIRFLWGINVLGLVLWYLSYPETTFRHNIEPFFIYTSQLTGICGFSLFAISFIFSTRLQCIEDLTGGLDKAYHLHHTIGKTAFFLILLHSLLLIIRWIPENIPKAFWYILPYHRRWGSIWAAGRS